LSATGLRVSEAVGLEWRHLELEGARPHVKVRRQLYRGRIGPPKSSKGKRDIPLSPALSGALPAHRERLAAAEDAPVFQTRAGRPLNPRDIRRRIIRPAADSLGLPWVGFHTFRHTSASLMFEREPNPVAVSRFLGHSSAQITLNTYLHLIRDTPMAPIDLGTELALEAKRATKADNEWTRQEGKTQEDQMTRPALELAQ
jgi:integrase